MNMGGPAQHVSILSGRLYPDRYETVLVSGEVGPGEASMAYLAERDGAHLVMAPGLGPELRPASDLRALASLIRLVHRFRPHIVDTHTAKAGFLGRLAALSVRPRPLLVHTYHGHVLEGYFGRGRSAFYRTLERTLARVTDCMIGVSRQVVDDLVRLRVGPRERFRVVPLGLDLEALAHPPATARDDFRTELGLRTDDILLTFVGRLVTIKRVDLLLQALAAARDTDARLVLAIVGDGELRPELETLARHLQIAQHVHFLGYRRDMPTVAAGTDIAVLASDNEGTPVSLIEAAAAAKPAVATDVGGVREVVSEASGVVVARGDQAAFAAALVALASDPARRERMGQAARTHVLERFGIQRMLGDIDDLYEELLRSRSCL
jgi:glycosyltransferase involved in cell wall biosynthesis